MDVHGGSTRNVAAITEQVCGVELSSTQVSRAAAQRDGMLEAWRNRPLGVVAYLSRDARYEQVRQAGQVRDAAVLIASGVSADGTRHILGGSVSLSEPEVHWRHVLQSRVARGLTGVHRGISDAHAGLQAARKAVFGGVPWQRCQFHRQHNAAAYVPRQDMKREVAAAIRAIFNAPNRVAADALLARTVPKYAKTAARLATWRALHIPDGLTIFAFPAPHRRLIRTTNGLERRNLAIRRRTRVVGMFPNEAACLRLVSAIAMELSDEWEVAQAYLTFSES